jgi:hypothetical protein
MFHLLHDAVLQLKLLMDDSREEGGDHHLVVGRRRDDGVVIFTSPQNGQSLFAQRLGILNQSIRHSVVD